MKLFTSKIEDVKHGYETMINEKNTEIETLATKIETLKTQIVDNAELQTLINTQEVLIKDKSTEIETLETKIETLEANQIDVAKEVEKVVEKEIVNTLDNIGLDTPIADSEESEETIDAKYIAAMFKTDPDKAIKLYNANRSKLFAK